MINSSYQKNKTSNPIISHSISRRNFVKQSAISLTGISMLGMVSAANLIKNKNTLRVIAYNIYLGRPWPVDRKLAEKANQKGQIPARLALEFALYEPDIIEFSEAPEESVVKEIADRLGMNYVYFPSAGNWPGAILTCHEISDPVNVPIQDGQRPDDLFTRHWGKAAIRLKNGKDLIVHSAHLYPHDTPEARDIRKREISEILTSTQDDINSGESILMLGDLNHTPGMPEYELWINAGWVDSFDEAGIGDGLTIRADEPERRIDYVLAHGPISKHIDESYSLFEGAFRTNPDDPASFALSDHLPVFATFLIDE